jgi:hypothetical protein
MRIAAEQEINNYENNGANAAANNKTPAARSASVFNVLALSSSLPKHPLRIVELFTRVYNPRMERAGKAIRQPPDRDGSGERAGTRPSFKWAGAHESLWATSEFQWKPRP